MKLYYHPVSTTSRPVVLFAAESGIDLDLQLVDLFTGEHMQEAYGTINPSRLVPMLEEEDGFRLTESSAILKYLADLVGSPAYPTELRARARVNERMDWVNTNLYRDFGYGLVYPQLLPDYRHANETVQVAVVARGLERSRRWLSVLDRFILGPDGPWLAGGTISLADYLASGIITLGEVIGCEFGDYPNVCRWLDAMKALPAWEASNEALYGLAATVVLGGAAFETV